MSLTGFRSTFLPLCYDMWQKKLKLKKTREIQFPQVTRHTRCGKLTVAVTNSNTGFRHKLYLYT